MATLQTVENTLRKFDIDSSTLLAWEEQLGLNIPVDGQGQKQYSHHHISLFKNIKKHLTLGRTIEQIRQLVTLPPVASSKASEATIVSAVNNMDYSTTTTLAELDEQEAYGHQVVKEFASVPQRPILEESIAATPSPTSLDLASQELTTANAAQQKQQGWTETSNPLPLTNTLPLNDSPRAALSLSKASVASHIGSGISTHNPNTMGSVMTPQALNLVDRLLTDKDHIHKKLVEAEKLNSHLYNVNNLFHRKVKELSALVVNLKANNREEANIKLMDDKARLHRQLLEAERGRLEQQREQDALQRQLLQSTQKSEQLESQLKLLCEAFDPNVLLGRWQEEATLKEVLFDNFGINVEQTRKLERHIGAVPARVFGNGAIISAQYEYESNPLWRRHETLSVAYQGSKQGLKGDLQVDYLLDGVVVARCLYSITASKLSA